VQVLEQFETTLTVWCPEHGQLDVVAVESDRDVGPFPADGVLADDRQPEVGEELDRGIEVADRNGNVLQLDSHAPDTMRRSDGAAGAA
jgi:hypothetical protein